MTERVSVQLGRTHNSNLPLLADERIKRLGSLFYSFVESFRGRVSISTEDLVLGQEKTLW